MDVKWMYYIHLLSFISFSAAIPKDQCDCLLRFSCSGNNHPFVILERPQPALDIGSIVAETLLGLKAKLVHDATRTDLGDQLLLAVVLAAKRRDGSAQGDTVQPLRMPGTVRSLMERRVIVADGVLELLH